jgi:hypothetical protein
MNVSLCRVNNRRSENVPGPRSIRAITLIAFVYGRLLPTASIANSYEVLTIVICRDWPDPSIFLAKFSSLTALFLGDRGAAARKD